MIYPEVMNFPRIMVISTDAGIFGCSEQAETHYGVHRNIESCVHCARIV